MANMRYRTSLGQMNAEDMTMIDWQCEDMARQSVVNSPEVQEQIAEKKAALKAALADVLKKG